MKKVLVLEDEVGIRSFLVINLKRSGYEPLEAGTGAEAFEQLRNNPDIKVALLDVMLPDTDGFEVCRKIRASGNKMGIIMLTARTQEMDKVTGLMTGADDYVTKPFSMEELLARLNATIRRSFDDGKPDKNIFHIGDIVFDYMHQTLTHDDQVQRLTMKECELLRMFAMNFNQLVDRSTTLQKIWKDDSYFAARSMDVYITKLRKYLKMDPKVQIVNVHGVGFRLTVKSEQ